MNSDYILFDWTWLRNLVTSMQYTYRPSENTNKILYSVFNIPINSVNQAIFSEWTYVFAYMDSTLDGNICMFDRSLVEKYIRDVRKVQTKPVVLKILYLTDNHKVRSAIIAVRHSRLIVYWVYGFLVYSK